MGVYPLNKSLYPILGANEIHLTTFAAHHVQEFAYHITILGDTYGFRYYYNDGGQFIQSGTRYENTDEWSVSTKKKGKMLAAIEQNFALVNETQALNTMKSMDFKQLAKDAHTLFKQKLPEEIKAALFQHN